MFGEMLGIWCADIWRQLGKPGAFSLVECGPGRGTLMADLLRAVKHVQGFHEACHVQLLEISPVLKQRQRDTLSPHVPIWHESFDTLPVDRPVILIANEFLDALPVHHHVGAQERLIGWDDKQGFHFTLQGEVKETSPARREFMRDLSKLLQTTTGAALLIDYGSVVSGFGDTLQAVYKHRYADPLKNIGHADLTTQVDFEDLMKAASVTVHGPVVQGVFLKRLGIETRADVLQKLANERQKHDISTALRRLTETGQMGDLFKVMGVSHGSGIAPSGF